MEFRHLTLKSACHHALAQPFEAMHIGLHPATPVVHDKPLSGQTPRQLRIDQPDGLDARLDGITEATHAFVFDTSCISGKSDGTPAITVDQ